MEIDRRRLNDMIDNVGIELVDEIKRTGTKTTSNDLATAVEVIEQYIGIGAAHNEIESFKLELENMARHAERLPTKISGPALAESLERV